jgi:hypothetical protein
MVAHPRESMNYDGKCTFSHVKTKAPAIRGRFRFNLVPREGLEPSQYLYRRILSPLRLPIPPSRQCKMRVYRERAIHSLLYLYLQRKTAYFGPNVLYAKFRTI